MSYEYGAGPHRGALVCAALLSLASACGAQSCSRLVTSADDITSIASETELVTKLETLESPPGFTIELYTAEVPDARSIALGSNGVVFVGTREEGKIYAVVDHDADHRVDEVLTIAEGLDMPNGVAYDDGDLYVAENSRILRFEDIDEQLDDPPEPKVVIDALPTEEFHGWRYIKFGPDGRLYIGIGAPCNACESDDPRFASIARMYPDEGELEVYASGVRNSVGFDWHPLTQELWFTDNGRDWLGDDLPPDELNRAPMQGLHFGFPYCHGRDELDPELGEGHSCDDFEAPVQELGPHVAALGMRFYSGGMFPMRYRNAVILAEHGSWNRAEKIGYRVTVVSLEHDKAVGYEPLVEGFLEPASNTAWGRPVDVAVLDDGSMLVSDDLNGALYRISYDGFRG